jgi:hypothetical protein
MDSGLILILVVIVFCSLLSSSGIGIAYYLNPFNWAILPELDSISCKNQPCKVGEGCMQGQGKCDTGLFCNANSKCEAKRPDGSYCPGILGGDYCRSGKCGASSTCLNSAGKAVEGAACSVVDQCADGLWCGGVPIQCRKPGNVGDFCVAGQHSQCKPGLYCDSTSKCANPRNDGEGCFVGAGCKSGKCGSSLVCLTSSGKLPNFAGVCTSDNDCLPGNKCSGFGGRGSVCQPLSNVGESCTFNSGCKSGLLCNGLTCYDPKDPCKCIGAGGLGNLCGDWDASGFRWCYVVNGPACIAKGGTVVTKGSNGYWKKCTGNH